MLLVRLLDVIPIMIMMVITLSSRTDSSDVEALMLVGESCRAGQGGKASARASVNTLTPLLKDQTRLPLSELDRQKVLDIAEGIIPMEQPREEPRIRMPQQSSSELKESVGESASADGELPASARTSSRDSAPAASAEPLSWHPKFDVQGASTDNRKLQMNEDACPKPLVRSGLELSARKPALGQLLIARRTCTCVN